MKRPRGIWRGAGIVASAALVLTLQRTAALAQMSPREQRGYTFARANCGQCHSVDKVTPSPLTIAPPFRELHRRYPVETLEEALGEGISTGHPNMPEFVLEADQIGDVISFLKYLER